MQVLLLLSSLDALCTLPQWMPSETIPASFEESLPLLAVICNDQFFYWFWLSFPWVWLHTHLPPSCIATSLLSSCSSSTVIFFVGPPLLKSLSPPTLINLIAPQQNQQLKVHIILSQSSSLCSSGCFTFVATVHSKSQIAIALPRPATRHLVLSWWRGW